MFYFEIETSSGKIFTEEFKRPEEAFEAAQSYWHRSGKDNENVSIVRFYGTDGSVAKATWSRKYNAVQI
jgi:hypothetical protein